jgi:hypothetical protein
MSGHGEYQVPKTTDVLSVSLACLFVILLGYRIAFGFYSPKYSKTIKAEAIINAYQIWELHNKYSEKEKEIPLIGGKVISRRLASVGVVEKQGLISRDPWLNPYRYQIREIDEFKKQIVVWSIGPDGKNNSDESSPILSGDDVGDSLIIYLK